MQQIVSKKTNDSNILKCINICKKALWKLKKNVGELLFKVKCQCSSEKFIVLRFLGIGIKLKLVPSKWEEDNLK